MFFFIEFDTLADYQQLISEFPVKLQKETQKKTNEQGQQLVKLLREETVRKDAIGATKRYLHSHKVVDFVPVGNIAGIKIWNDSPYAEYVERGRGKGPVPEKPLRAWMRIKGIPQEAFWPIRKAIANNGTIKRTNYDGLRIYDKVIARASDKILLEMSEVLEIAIHG